MILPKLGDVFQQLLSSARLREIHPSPPEEFQRIQEKRKLLSGSLVLTPENLLSSDLSYKLPHAPKNCLKFSYWVSLIPTAWHRCRTVDYSQRWQNWTCVFTLCNEAELQLPREPYFGISRLSCIYILNLTTILLAALNCLLCGKEKAGGLGVEMNWLARHSKNPSCMGFLRMIWLKRQSQYFHLTLMGCL